MLVIHKNLFPVRSCLVMAKRFGNSKERIKKGLHPHPSVCSPLTDLPDYSYLDGRGFGEMTIGQKRRYLKNVQIAETIIKNMEMFRIAKELVPDKK